MRKHKDLELHIVLTTIAVLFALFLAVPMTQIAGESFGGDGGFSLAAYKEIFTAEHLGVTLRNSIRISLLSSLVTTLLAFTFAYAVHFTNLPGRMTKVLKTIALAPMFLPTITYGFAIIYTFGKNGLFTRAIGGHQLFGIYGFPGLMIGYVLFTLPVAFSLIHTTMNYIDQKYIITSKLLGDGVIRSFYTTVFRPLIGTLAISVLQCFCQAFTDYGIPMAVGGRTQVVATALYKEMLGAIPNFQNGSAIAIVMLLPSLVGIVVVTLLERTNIRYQTVSKIPFRTNILRDGVWGTLSTLISAFVVLILASIVIVPCVKSWPYDLSLTTANISKVLQDNELTGVYVNSVVMALLTAVFGTLLAYGAALVSTRSQIRFRRLPDRLAFITSSLPGMVIGIAYMLTFSGTSLQNTFGMLVICTMIHYFSTPYLMMKNSLEKLDASWETTARLLGDGWVKTVVRVITPSAVTSLTEVFRYFFINAMVTVSAVIFIVGPDTGLLTTKIQELEHFQQFNDIFVLSMMILLTNLLVTLLSRVVTRYTSFENRKESVVNDEEEFIEKDIARPARRNHGGIRPDGLRQQF